MTSPPGCSISYRDGQEKNGRRDGEKIQYFIKNPREMTKTGGIMTKYGHFVFLSPVLDGIKSSKI